MVERRLAYDAGSLHCTSYAFVYYCNSSNRRLSTVWSIL